MVYEQTIRDLFSSYGCEVEDVVLREFSINEVHFFFSNRNNYSQP